MASIPKCVFVGLLTVPFVTATASIASAAVITFDSVPSSDVSSYTESGVTFTALDGGKFSALADPNGTNGLVSIDTPRSELKATFSSSVSQVSVDLGDYDADADTLVLRAYDASNNLLQFTSLLIASSFTGMKTLSVSIANIAYVTFGSEAPSINGSSVLADNFTFSVVPLPAALPLFATGLGALGLLGWRRKREKAAA